MAAIKADKKLRAPLLDRLFDDNPQVAREADNNQHQVLRQLRESVRRDLERLFNTRARCLSTPAAMPALATSLLNYGLPDLANYNLLASESRKTFCRDVERIILQFEPRIHSAKVIAEQSPDGDDHTFSFRVEAMLRATPSPEVVVFDSVLNPVSHTVDITESVQ
jgi:type VI secretion system protein ImpF